MLSFPTSEQEECCKFFIETLTLNVGITECHQSKSIFLLMTALES